MSVKSTFKVTVLVMVMVGCTPIAELRDGQANNEASHDSKVLSLGNREVLLDNNSVEVVRLTYPAGSESGMHSHTYPYRVAYFVKDGRLLLEPQDSTQQSTTLKVSAGQTLFLPAATHNIRNIGDTEVIIIETELKQKSAQ